MFANRITKILCLAACGATAAFAPAQFAFPSFQAPSNLTLTGNSLYTGGALRLTRAVNDQMGFAWHNTKQPIASGFETTFQFRVTSPNGAGADGFTFAIQNTS